MKRAFPAVSCILYPVSFLLTLLLLAGAFGLVLRDRWVVTGLMMNVPLLPIGVVALVIDLLRRGRGLPRAPFGLTILALPCIAWSTFTMIGAKPEIAATPDIEPIRILHWNVQWGGGSNRSEAAWTMQCEAIAAQSPDIVILSEAPVRAWLPALSEKLKFALVIYSENRSDRSYWYRLAVTSRWPVRLEGTYELTNGVAMSAVVERPDGDIRLLIVDGVSNPFVSRLPLLRDIDKLQSAARMLGQPFDVIAGDFNTTSRSIGFDALRFSRFALASEHSGHWRGTFPSFLPLYDIDHVWSSPRFRITGCDFFSHHSTTNHRGQLLSLAAAHVIALPPDDK